MNGFTKSIDRKIEASKRRQAEEERAKAPNRAPTQGLTDQASTANNNVPMRKPTVTLPDFGAVEHGIRRITEIGIGGGMPGQMVERVIFDPAIIVQEGDTIEMRSGIVHVKPGEMTLERLQAAGRQACIEAIEVTPGRAALPVDQICTVGEAMARLKLAMKEDPDYARTWHDNIACAVLDGQVGIMQNHPAANAAAAILMHRAFEIDTQEHARALNAREMAARWTAGSLDAQLARGINSGCGVIEVDAKGVMASETYVRRMQLDPKAEG